MDWCDSLLTMTIMDAMYAKVPLKWEHTFTGVINVIGICVASAKRKNKKNTTLNMVPILT
jgi:hypothetical protein